MAIDNGLSDLVQSPKSDLPELKESAEQMSVNRLSRIIKILMQTDRDIKEYGYSQLQLEAALIQMNSLEEGIPLQEIVDKLSELEQKLDTAGVSAPQRQQMPDFQQPDGQNTSAQTSIPKRQDPRYHRPDLKITTQTEQTSQNYASTPWWKHLPHADSRIQTPTRELTESTAILRYQSKLRSGEIRKLLQICAHWLRYRYGYNRVLTLVPTDGRR